MAVGLRGPWLAKPWGYLLLVGRLYLSCSSHASVAVPLNLFDLARSHIHLEGAIAPDSTFPILPGNGVVTCGQRNPKPALIISREGCNRVISLLYNESSIRKRSRIGNAQSRRPTMNGAYRNHPFEPCVRVRCSGGFAETGPLLINFHHRDHEIQSNKILRVLRVLRGRNEISFYEHTPNKATKRSAQLIPTRIVDSTARS